MPKQSVKTPNLLTWLPTALIVLGILLISLWGVHRYFYMRSLTLSDAILAAFAKQKPQGSLPVRITVGKSINLPVIESGKIGDTWAVSQTSANHVLESAEPGNRGNIIIYAHNAGNLFGPLDKTTIGDPISVRTTDGITHKYIVASVTWVTPGHTELLAPTTIETLTLYTCGGLLDSLRIVVRAVPAE